MGSQSVKGEQLTHLSLLSPQFRQPTQPLLWHKATHALTEQ